MDSLVMKEEYKKIIKETDKYIKKSTSVNQIMQHLAVERTKVLSLMSDKL